jgi:hypothetical protein
MSISSIDVQGWILMAVAIVAIFFGWRRQLLLWQTIKRNRKAGMYADPEFKRRIKLLNIRRYSLIGGIILEGAAAIWASLMGVAPAIYWSFFLIFVVPTTIWAAIVDGRWRKLMTKGIEDNPRA